MSWTRCRFFFGDLFWSTCLLLYSFSCYSFSRSRREVFYKKWVVKCFAKLKRKHLCWSLFFNKFATLLKRRLPHRCFSVNFWENFKNTFALKHLPWLRLVPEFSNDFTFPVDTRRRFNVCTTSILRRWHRIDVV